MQDLKDRIAVITGGASGIGRELAQIAVGLGMRVALADVQADALESAVATLKGQSDSVFPMRVDVSRPEQVEALAFTVRERFGVPHLLFNNAGVSVGGFVWENTSSEWEWVLGVNLLGVAYGVRAFVPMMLEAAKRDPTYRAHVVNTASMAGLLNPPLMGLYNLSKHAVVSLSETLYHDLALVTDRVHAHVLCPYFVPTRIVESDRNRRDEVQNRSAPTRSQQVALEMSARAISHSHTTAAQVAAAVFDAIRANRFYIYSHPQSLGTLQTRCEDLVSSRNPSDPFRERPDIRARIREALG